MSREMSTAGRFYTLAQPVQGYVHVVACRDGIVGGLAYENVEPWDVANARRRVLREARRVVDCA